MRQLDSAQAASRQQPKSSSGKHKHKLSPIIQALQDQVGQKATNGMQQFTQ